FFEVCLEERVEHRGFSEAPTSEILCLYFTVSRNSKGELPMFPAFARKSLNHISRSRIAQSQKRLSRPWVVEQLEDRVVPSTLGADNAIYAPGEEAVLHLYGLATGERVAIQVIRTDSGTGTTHTSPTWLATDGGLGDFDGVADGQLTFLYR